MLACALTDPCRHVREIAAADVQQSDLDLPVYELSTLTALTGRCLYRFLFDLSRR